MNCPSCKKSLHEEDGCHSCPECGGTWFELEQARAFLGLDGAAAAPEEDLLAEYGGGEEAAPAPIAEQPSAWSCPTCGTGMRALRIAEDLTLDQCPQCRGLFLEGGETLTLQSKIAGGHGLREQLAQALAPKR